MMYFFNPSYDEFYTFDLKLLQYHPLSCLRAVWTAKESWPGPTQHRINRQVGFGMGLEKKDARFNFAENFVPVTEKHANSRENQK